MAVLWARLRADEAQGLWTAIDAHAHALAPTHDNDADDADERTIDQKRADVLADFGAVALNNASGTRQGLKHEGGWPVNKDHLERVTWTSPTGRDYRTEPQAYPVDATTAPPPF